MGGFLTERTFSLFGIVFLTICISTSFSSQIETINGNWKWIAGSTSNPIGNYGGVNVPGANFIPGARDDFGYCKCLDGTMYLFGGRGSTNTVLSGMANDLWMFNPNTLPPSWTLLGGSLDLNQKGKYGTVNEVSGSTWPGSRAGHTMSCVTKGVVNMIYLFGGFGKVGENCAENNYTPLNDLWVFNSASQTFTWLKGSNCTNNTAIYGNKSQYSADSTPGGRNNAFSYVDNSQQLLYIFGGIGVALDSSIGFLDDMWSYNFNTNEYAWVYGSDHINSQGNSTNVPSLSNPSLWVKQSRSMVYLFGGSSITHQYRADFWQYNVSSTTWTNISPYYIPDNFKGVYNVKGISLGNYPSARYGASTFTDSSGSFWLFGGIGCATYNQHVPLNDLWKITFTGDVPSFIWVSGSNFGSEYLPRTTGINGRTHSTHNWIDSLDTIYVFGGWTQANQMTSTDTNDFYQFKLSSPLVWSNQSLHLYDSSNFTDTATVFDTSQIGYFGGYLKTSYVFNVTSVSVCLYNQQVNRDCINMMPYDMPTYSISNKNINLGFYIYFNSLYVYYSGSMPFNTTAYASINIDYLDGGQIFSTILTYNFNIRIEAAPLKLQYNIQTYSDDLYSIPTSNYDINDIVYLSVGMNITDAKWNYVFMNDLMNSTEPQYCIPGESIWCPIVFNSFVSSNFDNTTGQAKYALNFTSIKNRNFPLYLNVSLRYTFTYSDNYGRGQYHTLSLNVTLFVEKHFVTFSALSIDVYNDSSLSYKPSSFGYSDTGYAVVTMIPDNSVIIAKNITGLCAVTENTCSTNLIAQPINESIPTFEIYFFMMEFHYYGRHTPYNATLRLSLNVFYTQNKRGGSYDQLLYIYFNVTMIPPPITTKAITTKSMSTGVPVTTRSLSTGLTSKDISTGVTTGFTTGLTTGITTGVTTGITSKDISTGVTTGFTTGITSGITTGDTTGITTGITTGVVTSGETTGVTTGDTTGITTGITTGVTTGDTTGVTTGITTSDVTTGDTTGVTTGITTGDVTTSDVTTNEVTSGLTSNDLSTSALTTKELTTISMTTQSITTKQVPITTNSISTGVPIPQVNVTVEISPNTTTEHECTFCSTNMYVCSNETGWNDGIIPLSDPREQFHDYEIESLMINVIRMKWCTVVNGSIDVMVANTMVAQYNKEGGDDCSCNQTTCNNYAVNKVNGIDWSNIQTFSSIQLKTTSYVCLASFQMNFDLKYIGSVSSSTPTSTNAQIVEESSPNKSNKPANWLIAVIVAAGSVCCLLILIIAILLIRKKKKKKEEKKDTHELNEVQSYSSVGGNILPTQYSNIPNQNNYSVVPTQYSNIPDQTLAKLRPVNSITANRASVRLNKYLVDAEEVKIFTELGHGAFGTVYSGVWRSTQVAVKVLKSEIMRAEDIGDFMKEVNIMMNMKNHINVVSFLGYCDDPLCLITEFLIGGSLDKYLTNTNNQIDYKTKKELIKGIAVGMHHLQLEKIVHKDLAARNILLSEELVPKVSDFGLSRQVDNEAPIYSKTDTGPLRWMAPESLLNKKYSVKSDVWMFGITCIEIITRTSLPYQDLEMLEFSKKVIEQTLNPMNYVDVNSVDSTMYKLLRDCFSYDPNERPDFVKITEILGCET